TAKKSASAESPFPAGVAQPAVRALNSVGVTDMNKLAKHREVDIAGLHGMGPKALTALKAALKQKGKSFQP
ncbi:MAG: DNA-binding protein, partial [Gemmatimonadota bacterium]|nr:DNA-binding protein [Gemmatimonadota bacterium]